MSKFGKILRRIRQEKGLYLKDVADHMGWSVVYVSDIERGNRNPPAKKDLIKLSRYLGMDPEGLLNRADSERGFIEFDLQDLNKEQQNTALCLARRMNNLSEDQLRMINSIIDKKGDD
jgi:transcriptional regulator with XRE-family HTH domain